MADQSWLANTLAKARKATLDGSEAVRIVHDPAGTPASRHTLTGDIANHVLARMAAGISTTLGWLGPVTDNVAMRYTPATVTPAAPKFSLSFQAQTWTNGPGGEPTYLNQIGHLGWNWVGGTREDAGQAGFGLSFESRFWGGTSFGHEFHVQGENIDGTARRWLTMFLPTSGVAGSGLTTNVDTIQFNTGAAASRVTLNLASSPPTVGFTNGVQLLFDNNNVQVLKQKDSAGNFVALPYIDSFNRIAVGAGLFVNAAAADAEFNAVVMANVTTLASNKALYYGQMSNVLSGNCYAFNFYNMNASGKAIGGVGNNHATGHAILEARTEVTGGDPILSVQVNGETGYSIGIDNSDSNKFKISAGVQRLGSGTEDRVVIDDNTVAVVNRPFKLPSYTVAGLPSASTAGAGAVVYVSNASGGPTLACSDGTNWKVVAALGATVS